MEQARQATAEVAALSQLSAAASAGPYSEQQLLRLRREALAVRELQTEAEDARLAAHTE